MSLMKMVDGVVMPMTDEEIAQREADEAAWLAGANARALVELEQSCGMPRWQRDMVIASLPEGHPQRVKAEAIESQIAALNVRNQP